MARSSSLIRPEGHFLGPGQSGQHALDKITGEALKITNRLYGYWPPAAPAGKPMAATRSLRVHNLRFLVSVAEALVRK